MQSLVSVLLYHLSFPPPKHNIFVTRLIVLHWCTADACCVCLCEAETDTQGKDVFLCECVFVDRCVSHKEENECGCYLHQHFNNCL